jgi:3-hydroxybutyryl-CoA dehydrogenase
LKQTKPDVENFPAGVVGLGLMGTSIAACLLAAGHVVTGADSDALRRKQARRKILAHLREMRSEGMLKARPEETIGRFAVVETVAGMRGCALAIEAIFEDVEAKRSVIRSLEECLSARAIVGSNTSAIPVSILQAEARHPERVVGIHWAEPAHITRFMEIVRGDRTSARVADKVFALAQAWGKEPTLVRRDVRGFITNRIMYAMIREAFYLVESGAATIADVDRSVRNDMGYWLTFAGPFRFMDLTGIAAYAAVMRDLLPELDCSAQVPETMCRMMEKGAEGIANGRGFYTYTEAEQKRWRRKFQQFTFDIRRLAEKYKERG